MQMQRQMLPKGTVGNFQPDMQMQQLMFNQPPIVFHEIINIIQEFMKGNFGPALLAIKMNY